MTYYGRIRVYEASTGTGTIAPEHGGAVISFQQLARSGGSGELLVSERYSYEINNSHPDLRAINLRRAPDLDQIRKEQARNQRG